MRQQGFTLIELTTTLLVIATLFSVGNSGYSAFVTQSRASKDISNLLLMLRSTRQQAISSSTTAVLCPSINSITCVRNWKLPVMQFEDTNKNKRRDQDEKILNILSPLSNDDVIIKYPKSQVRFNARGMAGYYNGTFSYCLEGFIHGIVISRIGRIRFAQDLDGDHIPDVNSNTPISCE